MHFLILHSEPKLLNVLALVQQVQLYDLDEEISCLQKMDPYVRLVELEHSILLSMDFVVIIIYGTHFPLFFSSSFFLKNCKCGIGWFIGAGAGMRGE